jgi:hypothetical protein
VEIVLHSVDLDSLPPALPRDIISIFNKLWINRENLRDLMGIEISFLL